MSDTIPSSCDSLNGRIAGKSNERANATEKDGETKRRTGRDRENNAGSIVKSRPSRFPRTLLSSFLLSRPRRLAGGSSRGDNGRETRRYARASRRFIAERVPEEREALFRPKIFYPIREIAPTVAWGTHRYTHTQDTEWIGRDTDATRPTRWGPLTNSPFVN